MHDIKLVYLSCWEVYSGYRSSNLLADESLPLFPKGPYAETKYLCEMLIEHCRRTTALRCTILRASPVYGVYSERPKFIYNFIEKIKNSQHIVTHSYKNALPALDLLFIDDLVAAVMRIVNSGFSGNLNIGTGVATSTLRVAEILRELLDGQNEINTTLIDGDIACIAMDSRKIQDILGWRATVSVEQGLQSILSSLKAN